MRRTAIVALSIFGSVIAVQGQAARYDHVHMAAPDPAKAAEWYAKNVGGGPGDMPDRVVIDACEETPKWARSVALTSAGVQRSAVGSMPWSSVAP